VVHCLLVVRLQADRLLTVLPGREAPVQLDLVIFSRSATRRASLFTVRCAFYSVPTADRSTRFDAPPTARLRTWRFWRRRAWPTLPHWTLSAPARRAPFRSFTTSPARRITSRGHREVCRHQALEAVADALPLMLSGHRVYGIKVVSDDNGACTPPAGSCCFNYGTDD